MVYFKLTMKISVWRRISSLVSCTEAAFMASSWNSMTTNITARLWAVMRFFWLCIWTLREQIQTWFTTQHNKRVWILLEYCVCVIVAHFIFQSYTLKIHTHVCICIVYIISHQSTTLCFIIKNSWLQYNKIWGKVICFCKVFCSSRLFLFDPKYSKNSNNCEILQFKITIFCLNMQFIPVICL